MMVKGYQNIDVYEALQERFHFIRRGMEVQKPSPINDYAKDALNLYRVIDPGIWTKLVGRVRGANSGAMELPIIH